jgi:hypothetical protein
MQVFPETAVRINSLEADMQSPRYGLPTEYDISMMDPLEFSSLGAWERLCHPTGQAYTGLAWFTSQSTGFSILLVSDQS